MTFGTVPFGTLAYAVLPAGAGLATQSPFQSVTDDSLLVYLIEAQPYERDQTVQTEGVPLAFGVAAYGERFVRQRGGTRTVYLSQQGHITAATDATLANQRYAKKVTSALNVTLRLGGADGQLGAGSGSRGELVIEDWRELEAETGVDLTELEWAQRNFELLAGLRTFARAEFGRVFRGRLGDASWDRGSFRLPILDPKDRLGLALNLPTFAGTGGAEGPPELIGQTKPMTGGRKRQVPGTPLDRALHIWQWNFRVMQAFLAVRVRGDDVTFDGNDYATYAELAAAVVESGNYATCLALGMARLGTEPDGEVTADLDGDAAGGYVSTVGALVRRLATRLLPGQARLADPAEIDAVAFAQLEIDEPGTAGFHIPSAAQAPTARDLIDELVIGIGGWWDFDLSGQLFIVLAGVPTKPVRTIPRAEIDHDAGGVDVARAAPAVRSVQVGYRQMVETLSENDIAAGLDAASKELFTTEWRYPTATTSVRAMERHADAVDLVINSPLDDAAAALRVQERLGPFYAIRPRTFTVPLTTGFLRYQTGITVRLDDPLTGLKDSGDGLPIFWIIGLQRDTLSGDLRLELFGSTEPAVVPAANVSETPGDRVFFANQSDAQIECTDATYLTARAGGGSCSVASTTTTMNAGQFFLRPPVSEYTVLQSALVFDTSSIGASATIISAVLSLAGGANNNTENMTIEARIITTSDPVVVADFTAGADLGSSTLVATLDPGNFQIGAYNDFADVALSANINKTGLTYIVLSSDRQRLGSVPTGFEFLGFLSADAPALLPKLTVTVA